MKKIFTLAMFFAVLLSSSFSAQEQVHYSYDFESGLQGWTLVDKNADGKNWNRVQLSNAPAGLGSFALKSDSYITAPITPDNLAISPALNLSSTAANLYVSWNFLVHAQYPQDHYAVYVTTSADPNVIVASQPLYQETPNVGSGGTVQYRMINLDQFKGQTVYVTFRHYNCRDKYYIYLDNVNVKTIPTKDAEVMAINTGQVAAAGDNVAIKARIRSNGAEILNSAVVNWSIDGGAANSQTFTNLGLEPSHYEDITFTTPWTAVAGTHNLKVWISEVNGVAGDGNPSNDAMNLAINVASQSVQRRPVYEQFTSSTCPPCYTVNTNYFNHNYLTTNADKFTLVKYQMNWPGSGDPYYTAEGGVRRNYYGVTGVPQIYLDGKEVQPTSLLADLNAARAKPAFMKIEAAFQITGNSINVDAAIMPYISGNYKVLVSVVEKITTGNRTSNGETQFEHVMMKMLPNATGTAVTFTDGTPYQFSLGFDMSSTHVEEMNDLAVVVYVQDDSSKSMMQSEYAYEGLLATSEGNVANQAMLYPNPSDGFVKLSSKEKATVTVYDLSGKLVYTQDNVAPNAELNLTKLSKGVYIANITGNNFKKVQKIIIK